MTELHRRVHAEAHRVSRSEDAYGAVVHRAMRRRMARRVGGALLGLAIAGAGLGLAYATFGPEKGLQSVRQPTPSSGDQYRFGHITIDYLEDGTTLVRHTVDFERYPGVRECTWRAFDGQGRLVGAKTTLFASREPSTKIFQGRATSGTELQTSAKPTKVTVSCGSERLDDPRIAATRPYRREDRADPNRAIFARVLEWADRFNVDEMGDRERAANAHAIRVMMEDPSLSVDEVSELVFRVRVLEGTIPLEDLREDGSEPPPDA